MRLLITAGALLAFAAAGIAQDKKTEIKKAPVTYTNPTSGSEMFGTYCAVCHGIDGKGTGPAATALKKPPADLTMLSKKNGGKFPNLRVTNFIKGDPSATEAHGSRDMPMWGNVFKSVSSGDAVVDLRVKALEDYIAGLQQK